MPVAGRETSFDIAGIERRRVLKNGESALARKPASITEYRCERSPGSLQDYYSEADYWWPDPGHPERPFIRRDGYSYPGKFTAHRQALIRLSLVVPALAAAWKLTGEPRFAEHANRHLRTWFADGKTRMNPNLNYSQAIRGVNKGRGIGVIDSLHLVEVARAVQALQGAGDHQPVIQWFRDYLLWLNTSTNGMEEREEKNNHGSCWLLQCLQFAVLTGDQDLIAMSRQRLTTVILPRQISPDGSQKLELARTKPYSYSLFNLDVLSTIAHILAQQGENPWQSDPGLRQAVAFMYPYIENKSRWPYPPDVEYFDKLPVRQVNLLFAGLALNESKYLALWRKLDPDPAAGEIIRNFPIRQPLLWVS